MWVAAPLFVATVAWGWWRGTVDLRASRRELAELAARREQLETANRSLAREVKSLKTEREERARAARAALDAAAPGEVLVIVPSPTPRAGSR